MPAISIPNHKLIRSKIAFIAIAIIQFVKGNAQAQIHQRSFIW